jgi:transcription-repair coupling factor (superfamily II helicase)
MILPLVGELLARVGRHPAVERVLDGFRRGEAAARRGRLAGLTDTAKALVAASAAAALDRPVLFVVESNARAEQLAAPLEWFFRALTGRPAGAVETLPAPDALPWDARSPHPDISEARAVALWRLATGAAPVVLAPAGAALVRLPDAWHYRGLALELVRDGELPLDALLAHLVRTGYERREMVEMPGQFAARGGIVDVFSPEAARPVRVELLGDQVESLREFDPETQRSVRPLARAVLLPLVEWPRDPRALERAWARARGLAEIPENAAEVGTFPGWEFAAALDIPREHTVLDIAEAAGAPLVALDEPAALAEAMRAFRERAAESFANAGAAEAAPPEEFFLSGAEWEAALAQSDTLALEQLALDGADEVAQLSTQPTQRFHGNVAAFFAEARGRLEAGGQVLLAASSTGELERLADLCHDYEIAYRLGELDEADATLARLAGDATAGTVPALVLAKAPLAEGVAFPALGLVLHGTGDLFDTAAAVKAARRPAKAAAFFSDRADLTPGDYVVHLDHGIGRYDGLKEITSDGRTGEFMQLTYADDARLYVPLERMDLVQKYRTLGEARVELDRLGGTGWQTRKKRVRKQLAEMAERLLALYAERRVATGAAFSPDSAWQREFEDAFEFEETPDQARAIAEVKRDMERAEPMDRLLCGDVGYGKTEVAMRAAFKAVADSRQVAVLAPTTVLVFQHWETFRRRFAAFPVRIEMLSRFRSAKEQKRVLEELAAGKVDIVIGTHRLLSRDVRFHDLGLLVVDEEQRFGVAHKERIKELRRNVDVLTLSATPIPRTLHMSLVGLRDMSVIETPPKDRLAIQTVVAPFSERLVQSAIEQELERAGQVYFVHNRVETIASLAAMVKRLVPRARVEIGHGQMSEKELERVMLRFVSGEADVLVSTTIIENGLDIPRANTMLVNRADRFGLAELYQLRGRVGRADRRAYAYLLVPPGEGLSTVARKRLAALKEFSELGAGFRIAALDLELRGAGNLLGPQQHGHINAVGFELYCRMLERAVAERKGEAPAMELRTALNLGLDIRIPPEYIPGEGLRLRTYQRIAAVADERARDELRRELADRFGPPPAAVENLLAYALLKAAAERLGVAAVERRGKQVAVKFHPETPLAPERLVALVRRRRGLRLDPAGVLWTEAGAAGAALAEETRSLLLELEG